MHDEHHVEEQPETKRRGRRKKRRDGLLTTGDMARLSNSTLRTVRFYEEEQILRPTQRSEGGHRLFSECELEKLLLVTDMRAVGLSLEEIKTILELKATSKTGAEASRRVGEFLQTQIDVMRQRVEILQRLQHDFVQASAVFTKCRRCNTESGSDPWRCDDCGVMDRPGGLPRTVRVLWSVGRRCAAQAPELGEVADAGAVPPERFDRELGSRADAVPAE